MLRHSDLKVGATYKIKCGWGMTRAKLEGFTPYKNKYRYEWVMRNSFRFCSYDLDDTGEVSKRNAD